MTVMAVLRKIIPHVCIILSLLMLTLVILDHYNPGMDFVGNDFFKIMLIVFCLAAVIAAAFLLAQGRSKK
jgi:hypothetical protein